MTYTVYYKITNDNTNYVGTAYGENEKEALSYFDVFHSAEDYQIEEIKKYK